MSGIDLVKLMNQSKEIQSSGIMKPFFIMVMGLLVLAGLSVISGHIVIIIISFSFLLALLITYVCIFIWLSKKDPSLLRDEKFLLKQQGLELLGDSARKFTKDEAKAITEIVIDEKGPALTGTFTIGDLQVIEPKDKSK